MRRLLLWIKLKLGIISPNEYLIKRWCLDGLFEQIGRGEYKIK